MAKKTATATSESSSSRKVQGRTFQFVIPIEPVPASRPRVTRWGTYIAKPYKNWLDAAAEHLTGIPSPFPPEAHIRADVEIVCTKAKTSKLTRPHADIDNFAKAALDAINHAETYWSDDKQVTVLHASKRFAAAGEQAGTYITLTQL